MAITDVFDSYYEDKRNIVFLRKDYSHIEFERCKDGSLTFKINKDGKSVYAHSKYSPVKEAVRFVDGAGMKRDSVFIIFGFGLGHIIRELLKRASQRNFFFIYEPDSAVFSKIVDEGYCNDILESDNVYILSDNDVESFRLFLKTYVDEQLYMRSQTIITPGYDEVYKEEYVEFLKITKSIVEGAIIKRNTIFQKGSNWTKNSYLNTKSIVNSYSIAQFKDAFKGSTAVVVSAGPSLKKNMHLLKEIKGKIPIISVYVACKVLLENNIEPDFIVSVDNLQFGMEKGIYDNIPLIYDSRVPPEFIENHKGVNININSNTDSYFTAIMEKYKKEICLTHSGGSVACDCVSVAEIMGCKNIILIGQDLAYTNEQCHVDGTEHIEKTADDIEREKFLIPAVGGGEVLSDGIFKYYIDWFENYGGVKNGIVKLIDATEGGALIKNTEVITFREAIDKYCEPLNVDKIISGIFERGPVFSEDERKKFYEDFDKEFELLHKTIEIMEEQEELFDKYIKGVKYRSASNIKSVIKIERKVDEMDKEIQKNISEMSMIMGCGLYIEYANRAVSAMKRISIDDDVYESAIRRKNWLMERKASLKSMENLREDYKNV